MFTMRLLAIGNVTTAMQQAMLFNFHSTVQFVPLIFVLHVLKLRKTLWPINIHFYSGKQTGNFMRTKEDIGNVKCAKKVGTAEACSYHCRTCADFHICRSCFEPKQHPVHVHKLELVDTSLLYTECSGNWFCDICGSQSRPWEKLAYHCSECGNFDVCPHCYLPLVTPLHGHVLYKANS